MTVQKDDKPIPTILTVRLRWYVPVFACYDLQALILLFPATLLASWRHSRSLTTPLTSFGISERLGAKMQVLFLILILSTAMLLGNEFSVAVFIHPALARADHESFLRAIQVFAALFGKVMPFWMAATLLLHLVILTLSWHWPAASTVLLAAATLLWLVIIIFSVVGPVRSTTG